MKRSNKYIRVPLVWRDVVHLVGNLTTISGLLWTVDVEISVEVFEILVKEDLLKNVSKFMKYNIY